MSNTDAIEQLVRIIAERKLDASASSYTRELLSSPQKVYRKVNEETFELIYACMHEDKKRVASEAADLVYHMLVMLAKHDVAWDSVLQELSNRRGPATESD